MWGLSPALIWAIIGVALIILELVSTTFVLIFFGIGALVTAIATWAGLTHFASQVGIFAGTSVILLVLLRKTVRSLFCGHQDLPPEYLGASARVIDPIEPQHEGRVEYRGSPWIAFSDHTEVIPAGTIVEIVAVDGIRLKVALKGGCA